MQGVRLTGLPQSVMSCFISDIRSSSVQRFHNIKKKITFKAIYLPFSFTGSNRNRRDELPCIDNYIREKRKIYILLWKSYWSTDISVLPILITIEEECIKLVLTASRTAGDLCWIKQRYISCFKRLVFLILFRCYDQESSGKKLVQ